jgi:hypothetical protein
MQVNFPLPLLITFPILRVIKERANVPLRGDGFAFILAELTSNIVSISFGDEIKRLFL